MVIIKEIHSRDHLENFWMGETAPSGATCQAGSWNRVNRLFFEARFRGNDGLENR